MRIFKSRWFQSFARKERITDAALCEAVDRANRGQIDADLGGGVIKQRIARPGEGRSKGYRTIILFRRGSRAYFFYGFAKHQRANIEPDEEQRFKQAAKHVLSLTDEQLATSLERGDLWEIEPS